MKEFTFRWYGYGPMPEEWPIVKARWIREQSWYPCCLSPQMEVELIPGDTFHRCSNCGFVCDNFGP